TNWRILTQAAKEGNIQAVYNGFKMYPILREKKVYNDVLFHAAIGGHEAIISLLLDLGAENKRGEILLGVSIGGNMDLLMKQNVHDSRGHLSRHYEEAIGNASLHSNSNVLK